jgi:hypothetical protein
MFASLDWNFSGPSSNFPLAILNLPWVFSLPPASYLPLPCCQPPIHSVSLGIPYNAGLACCGKVTETMQSHSTNGPLLAP